MITKIIEATQNREGGSNHGKFLVGLFDVQEWEHPSQLSGYSILSPQWTAEHVLVLDLATGEGGMFRLGGYAAADLRKRQIWVCPMFEPFLAWLYSKRWETLAEFEALPEIVELPDAPFATFGYRRPGVSEIPEAVRRVAVQMSDITERLVRALMTCTDPDEQLDLVAIYDQHRRAVVTDAVKMLVLPMEVRDKIGRVVGDAMLELLHALTVQSPLPLSPDAVTVIRRAQTSAVRQALREVDEHLAAVEASLADPVPADPAPADPAP